MEKYFEIKTDGGLIYYKAPTFLNMTLFRGYATNTRVRPRLKFLMDYYGIDNIDIVEKPGKVKTEKYPTQVHIKSIINQEVVSYNIISKEVNILTDVSRKTFVNRYCLDGLLLYFTKDLFYNNNNIKEDIERIYNNFIKEFLKNKNQLKYETKEAALDSEGKLYLIVKL